MKILLTIFLAHLACLATLAQGGSVINGEARDENGAPVEGVTVTNKRNGLSAFSDAAGFFSLTNVVRGDSLTISHVAFETMSLKMASPDKKLQVHLIRTAENMESVTVLNTGYQRIPRERTTGSFDRLDHETFQRKISSGVLNHLEGEVSGMVFSRIRDSREITIRGVSSIFGDREPLIVVDNFPYDGSIDNINPNDIESVTILKDAAAASIWGARAGNGVIVLTTRKGREGQPGKVELNANITVTDKRNLFYLPRMKTSDLIDIETMLFENGRYDDELMYYPYLAHSPVVNILQQEKDGQISPQDATDRINALRPIDNRNDLDKYANHRAIQQQYHLDYTGGSTRAAYYLGVGYDRGIGSVKEKNDRISIDLQNNFLLSKSIRLSTAFVHTESRQLGATLPYYASPYPYENLADENGNALPVTRTYSGSFIGESLNKGLLDWTFKPLEDARENESHLNTRETRLSAGLSADLFHGLSLSLNYQYQRQDQDNENFHNALSYFARDLYNQFVQFDPSSGEIMATPIPKGGILETSHQTVVAHNARAQLNYSYSKGAHQVYAIGGVELRQTSTNGNGQTLYGYDPLTLTSAPVNFNEYYFSYPSFNYLIINGYPQQTGASLDRFRSAFSNATYTFKGRYSLSASARKDASNYFGVRTNQRAVPLWSAGTKWRIDKESFYRASILPELQLRATYGFSGNVNTHRSALTTIQYSGTDEFQQPYARISSPPNPGLRWEKTRMINFGMDFGFKNRIISGSVEYYLKKGTDLLGSADIDGTLGFTDGAGLSRFSGNIASMKGSGIDLRLTARFIDRAFKWYGYFLFSTTKDEVTKYDFIPTVNDMVSATISPLPGKPVYSIYSFPWAGLDPTTGAPRGLIGKEPSMDYAALITPDIADLVFHGSAMPRRFGSIRSEWQYKGFSLSVQVLYKGNYYFRRTSIDYGSLFGQLGSHSDYYKRWMKPGDEQFTDIPAMYYPANGSQEYFYKDASVLVERGDQLRLQDIRLSYSLPEMNHHAIPVHGLSVYVYVSNVGLLWKKNGEGIDPDYQQSIPPGRSAAVGITASF